MAPSQGAPLLGENAYESPTIAAVVLDLAWLHGEKRIVAAPPDIGAGVDTCSALANDDRTRSDLLTVEHFGTQSLGA